jgi:hypothetical protein
MSISLKSNQYLLIKDNIRKLSKISDYDSFKEFILSNLEVYANNMFDWTDELMQDVFNQMKKYYSTDRKDHDEFLKVFFVEETLESYDKPRTSSLSMTSKFTKIQNNLKTKLNVNIEKLEKVKNTFQAKEIDRAFIDFIKFGQELGDGLSEMEDINNQYNSYMNILNQNIEELNLIIEKFKLKEGELFDENFKLKSLNGLINRKSRNRS